MKDVLLDWFWIVVGIAAIVVLCYWVYRGIHWIGERATDQHCSALAWRTTELAGIDAGKAAYKACMRNES